MTTPPDADLQALRVRLEPPPGGLTRFRARRERRPAWPWLLGAALATTAALLLAVRVTPPPRPSPRREPVDLLAGADAATLHPAWVGLGRVAAPAEPMTLRAELDVAVAARRVVTGDDAVVLYMLEPR